VGTVGRSTAAASYRRLYATGRWKRLRAQRLAMEPLCRSCEAHGRTTAATVCDHIEPHRGDEAKFFDLMNTQSLCDADPWRCHSRHKQREDVKGYSNVVGADGWPTDARHPANR
jgi:5-methylcytosine-specific restriction enzyme A